MELPAGDYILSGCYDGSETTYRLYYDIYEDDTWKKAILVTTEEKTFTLLSPPKLLRPQIMKGQQP